MSQWCHVLLTVEEQCTCISIRETPTCTCIPWQLIFSRKSDCLGCAVLLCLVCLFDLACFFVSSFSSLPRVGLEPTTLYTLDRALYQLRYTCTCTCTCRLMRRRIKVANPHIFLISVAYMYIHEEVIDEYQTIT